jgi:hypothetical protein
VICSGDAVAEGIVSGNTVTDGPILIFAEAIVAKMPKICPLVIRILTISKVDLRFKMPSVASRSEQTLGHAVNCEPTFPLCFGSVV